MAAWFGCGSTPHQLNRAGVREFLCCSRLFSTQSFSEAKIPIVLFLSYFECLLSVFVIRLSLPLMSYVSFEMLVHCSWFLADSSQNRNK